MHKTLRRISMLVFFVVAVTTLGHLAVGQYSGVQCRNWQCTGTVGGCTLNNSYYIYSCFDQPGATCNLSGWVGICPGLDGGGFPCERGWYDCNNP
jgi:hypothetical protein